MSLEPVVHFLPKRPVPKRPDWGVFHKYKFLQHGSLCGRSAKSKGQVVFQTILITGLYRIFSVTMAKTTHRIVTIQNLVTILLSLYPSF